MSFQEFIASILHDLKQSLWLAFDTPLENQHIDWAKVGIYLAGTAIKIMILLTIISFLYWLGVYILKHIRQRLHLDDKTVIQVRSAFKYLWLFACFIAVLSQVGVPIKIVKAIIHATLATGFFYVLWAISGDVLDRVLNHYGLNASIEQLSKNVFSVFIVVVGSATVMAQFGLDIVSIVAGLGIVGLAVGFAAQSTLANFIAGITILLEQSFQVGDWIRINNKEGKVIRIALRTTHIRTRDNISIIVPNSNVASSEVINLTARQLIRFDLTVRITYEADIDKARQLILDRCKQLDIVLEHPAMIVTVQDLSETGVVLLVRYWLTPTHVAKLPIIQETLLEEIKKVLAENGIEIPYPQMKVLHLNQASNAN